MLLRKPGWRLPSPHHQHFPVPKTTALRPLHQQPQCQERLLPSDRRHVLPLWLAAWGGKKNSHRGSREAPSMGWADLGGTWGHPHPRCHVRAQGVGWWLRLHLTLRCPTLCGPAVPQAGWHQSAPCHRHPGGMEAKGGTASTSLSCFFQSSPTSFSIW